MPYYPKPEATAWWDPDEVRAREEDVIGRKLPPSKLPWWFVAPLALFAGMGRARSRPAYATAPMRLRPKPGSCDVCVSGTCPMSPQYNLRGQYGGGRFFELVDATPYKKVWRCSRCGETFRGISSDNPANLHSC